MTTSSETGPRTFISRFNRVVSIIVWVLAAVLVVVTLVTPALRVHAAYALVAPFAVYLAWLLLWRPHLTVSDDRMTVVNVARTIEVPWPALIHVDTKYALTLITPNRRVSVWAAPAPGRTAVLRQSKAETGAERFIAGGARPGDRLTSDSGQAAYIVRERWERLREAGLIEAGIADEATVASRVHWGLLILLVALGVVAAIGVAVA